MKNGFVSWIVFNPAFEPLRLSSGFVICWLIEIWLQAGNYQIQSQPKIRIPISLLGMCTDRLSDRVVVSLQHKRRFGVWGAEFKVRWLLVFEKKWNKELQSVFGLVISAVLPFLKAVSRRFHLASYNKCCQNARQTTHFLIISVYLLFI